MFHKVTKVITRKDSKRMETIDGKICISHEELTGRVITTANLKALVRRGKINRLQRGGNGRAALYELESLPLKLRVEVYRKFGNPYDLTLGEIVPKESTIAYFSEYNLPNGQHLTLHYIEKYAYSCAILDELIKLHEKNSYGWDELAKCLLKTNCPHCLPKSTRRLRFIAEMYKRKGPEAIISKRFGNHNAKKEA